MASVTTVQLFNRVNRYMRFGDDVASLEATNVLHNSIIDMLNAAKDEVLEGHNWDFDTRHDGVLLTQAQATTGTVSVTNGSETFTTSTSDVVTADGGSVFRIRITSDASFGDTAFRVIGYTGTGGIMDAKWPGTTDATATYEIWAAEYLLPTTVKDVLSVRFQEHELELYQLGRNESFHSLVPKLHSEINDNPRIAVIGGAVTGTEATGTTWADDTVWSDSSTWADTTVSNTDTGLSLLVYPVPQSKYRIDYSFATRHPELTATNSLDAVPPYIVHDIVTTAVSLALASNIGNEPDLAKLTRQISELRRKRLHALNRPDPHRRTPLRSLDYKGSMRTGGPADPRVFHTP